MIFYNAYIPSLIRQENNIEGNLGHIIFHVIDPARPKCADYSQENEELSGENTGMQ